MPSCLGQTLINQLHKLNALTQRSFLEVQQILLDVLHAGSANQYRVSVLALHHAVVGEPAERNFGESQTMLLCDGLDLGESVKVGLVPVARTVGLRRKKRGLYP